MIDKLVIQIPFSPSWVSGGGANKGSEMLCADPFSRKGLYWVPVEMLPVSQGARSIEWVGSGDDRRPIPEELYCPWESLPSSYGGLAFKTYDHGNGHCAWPYVEMKCSPAKIAQGHNVWGFDDLDSAHKNMYQVLYDHYPEFFGGYTGELENLGVMLDFKNARVAEIDITYSASVPNEQHRLSFITLLHTLSRGQTRARGDSFQSTAYFGAKTSRLKKIKVYLKGPETKADQEERKRRGRELMSESVLKAAEPLIRVEATVKREWLDRRNIPSNLNALLNWMREDDTRYKQIFTEATRDMWRALEGQEITVINDKQVMMAIEKAHGDVRGKAARVFATYQTVKAVGLDVMKRQYPERTYRRIVTDLEVAGFSRAVLGNLHTDKPTIIQIAQVVNLETLGENRPASAEPVRLYATAA